MIRQPAVLASQDGDQDGDEAIDAAADHHAITPTTRSSLSDPAELDKTTLVSRFNRSVSYSKARQDGKIELKETDCYEVTGYSYATWKKWWILSCV